MKKLVFPLILSTVCSFFIGSKQVEPVYKYYFCFSREVPRFGSLDKLKMVYTDIRTAKSDEGADQETKNVIQKFGQFINKNCKPANELCTSDLNRYDTMEQAQKRHQEIINQYKTDEKYTVSRIDFKEFE